MRTTGSDWTNEQTAEIVRLHASGNGFVAITAAINAKFGTNRTRKACACHFWSLGQGKPAVRGPRGIWLPEHDDLLKSLLPTHTHSAISRTLNEQFGTNYTRAACIGRANRLGSDRPPRENLPVMGKAERERRANIAKREKRWAENPSLAELYKLRQRQSANRALMVHNGATTTSREYRRHMPKVGNMTKNELRSMLSQAVQNTAALAVAA